MITNRNVCFLILISKGNFMKYVIATIMALFATTAMAQPAKQPEPAKLAEAKKEAPKAEAKKDAPKPEAKKEEKKEAPKK
jgi:outer membrane biosynthesis protein TonB